ncbi:MAG: hypothetical protein Q4A29_00590 [Eubacteriales bacterium]|nr:hypothetical protein [Eubacteriales bacterium]
MNTNQTVILSDFEPVCYFQHTKQSFKAVMTAQTGIVQPSTLILLLR